MSPERDPNCHHRYARLSDGRRVCEKCGYVLQVSTRGRSSVEGKPATGHPVMFAAGFGTSVGGLLLSGSAFLRWHTAYSLQDPLITRTLVAVLGLVLCVAGGGMIYAAGKEKVESMTGTVGLSVSLLGTAIGFLLLAVGHGGGKAASGIHLLFAGSLVAAACSVVFLVSPPIESAIRRAQEERERKSAVITGRCERCGAGMTANQTICPGCGLVRREDPQSRWGKKLGICALAIPLSLASLALMVTLLAVRNAQNPWAELGYAFVFIAICVVLSIPGLVMSVLATVYSHRGLKRTRADPHLLGRNSGLAGLVLGIIGLLLYSGPIVAVLVGLCAIPFLY